jgi:hypothetical protein
VKTAGVLAAELQEARYQRPCVLKSASKSWSNGVELMHNAEHSPWRSGTGVGERETGGERGCEVGGRVLVVTGGGRGLSSTALRPRFASRNARPGSVRGPPAPAFARAERTLSKQHSYASFLNASGVLQLGTRCGIQG